MSAGSYAASSPFRRICNIAGQSEPVAPPLVAFHKMLEIRQAVDRASTCVPRATCLTGGLAAAVPLRFADLPYLLTLGVNKKEHAFFAHAWVTSGEVIVIGDLPDLANYVPVPIHATRGLNSAPVDD